MPPSSSSNPSALSATATEGSFPQAKERPIQVLPPSLINCIAAGEVVERPASVVKELVENALDAGASRIDITASDGGRFLRIADNGHGMSPANAALAFYNHATSKIQQTEDLDRITTLGFRGEALASIASISKLTCLTRTADAKTGTKIVISDSGEPSLSETGCAPGTIMEVADLFYNTPARLKFLKKAQTELGHVEEVVQQLALSHPEVRFSLTITGKTVLQTSGNGDLKQTLNELWGLNKEKMTLVPIQLEDAEYGLAVQGYASDPNTMKSSKRWQVTYINNRLVKCPILQKAMEAAYESLLPSGKYPLCVLSIQIPPPEVDVNVHPTKREVRYAAASTVFAFVRSAIRNALSEHGLFGLSSGFPTQARLGAQEGTLSAFSPFAPEQNLDATYPRPNLASYGTRPPAPNFNPPLRQAQPSGASSFSNVPRRAAVERLPVQAALSFYHPLNDGPNASQISTSAETGAQSSTSSSKPFKVIGQLFNTYILLESVQGLMVVDQHIASERHFFEALTSNITGESPDIQRLIAALPLPVSPIQRDLLIEAQAQFARLGFLYELGPESETVQLTGYPLVYSGRDKMFEAGGLFENLLAQLEETGHMRLDVENLIATLACHSAVRAGDSLTHEEMVTVIEHWLACKLPWTCPHGRPIAHTISAQELNHFFHRPSLPANALQSLDPTAKLPVE